MTSRLAPAVAAVSYDHWYDDGVDDDDDDASSWCCINKCVGRGWHNNSKCGGVFPLKCCNCEPLLLLAYSSRTKGQGIKTAGLTAQTGPPGGSFRGTTILAPPLGGAHHLRCLAHIPHAHCYSCSLAIPWSRYRPLHTRSLPHGHAAIRILHNACGRGGTEPTSREVAR